MAVVCIVYNLRKPGQQWPEMDEAIEAIGANEGRALNTTWFLATSLTPEQVFERVAHVTDDND